MPPAAVGMLVAILLDAGAATVVMAVIAVLAGAVNGGSLELAAYVLLGGSPGSSASGAATGCTSSSRPACVALVNVARGLDVRAARRTRPHAACSSCGRVAGVGRRVARSRRSGSFAVLGNLFGILTVFQLLELANPSQPLLRRLLIETPGTYHHSLMVGNLAERAAEAVGADPLLARIAAYYHDIGKLANPLAFIENQAGGDNIHDELPPEVSAADPEGSTSLTASTSPTSAKLPKALISFIPQHHGTALMSYFYAKAPRGGGRAVRRRSTTDGRDRRPTPWTQRRFRHAGPKPQSREAAILMLADSVEASVRSLSSRDEPAIRAMVTRIIDERLADGQFDECDLTLRDIERIREAFVSQLLGMYHQRIAYPQNKVVELESRRAAGRDGGGPAATSARAGADLLPPAVADRPHRPRRRSARSSRRRAGARRRARARRGRCTVARVDRADPVRRLRARRAQPRAHGRARARPTCCRSRCCRPRRSRTIPAGPPAARRRGRPSSCRRARPHLGDIVVSVERAVEQAAAGPRRPDRRRPLVARPTSCGCS